jgi:ribosome-associated protein
MRRARQKPNMTITSLDKALRAREALLDTRAINPVLLDLRELTIVTDYFLICHGTSNVHMRALAEKVLEYLDEVGVRPVGIEGKHSDSWVLLDYGDVIIHIFGEEEREFYSLERLWSDAPEVPLDEPATVS